MFLAWKNSSDYLFKSRTLVDLKFFTTPLGTRCSLRSELPYRGMRVFGIHEDFFKVFTYFECMQRKSCIAKHYLKSNCDYFLKTSYLEIKCGVIEYKI